MSTVHEVITARHSGLKVLAFSLISNLCEVDDDDDNDEEEEDNVESIDNVERVDVILEELTAVIAEKGDILKQFVSTLVKHVEKEI
jgi:purine nucleoside phosphorylase